MDQFEFEVGDVVLYGKNSDTKDPLDVIAILDKDIDPWIFINETWKIDLSKISGTIVPFSNGKKPYKRCICKVHGKEMKWDNLRLPKGGLIIKEKAKPKEVALPNPSLEFNDFDKVLNSIRSIIPNLSKVYTEVHSNGITYKNMKITGLSLNSIDNPDMVIRARL